MIPLRLIIAILGAYACSLVYMHRSGMSIAIVAMTKKPDDIINDNETTTIMKPEFEWNEKIQSIILGSQFYLYIIIPIFAGRATDAFGGKWIIFIGSFIPCLLALLTPLMIEWGDYTALIINRLIVGGFHGFTYASIFSLNIKWFPREELSIANSSLIFGGSMGITIMSLLSGYISQYLSWKLTFIAIGLFHIPFLILWFILATNEPETNRFITKTECQYIRQNCINKIKSSKINAPWLKILSSKPVICSLITKMCSAFGYFLMITKMPSYLKDVYNIELHMNGTIYALSYLTNGIATITAPILANALINRYNCKRLFVRKLFQSVALFGPALCFLLLTINDNYNINIIYLLLIMSMLLYGFFSAGEWIIITEYSQNFSGTVFGVANILAFAMGIIAPLIIGLLLDQNFVNDNNEMVKKQWNNIYYIAIVIYLIGGLTFAIFATDQQQSWDKIDDVADGDDKKIDYFKYNVNVDNNDDEERKTSISTTS